MQQELEYNKILEETQALARAVYRITDQISDQEDLKFRIRKATNEIVESVVNLKNFFNLETFQANLKLKFLFLKTMLDLAKSSYLAHPVNFDILNSECANLNLAILNSIDKTQKLIPAVIPEREPVLVRKSNPDTVPETNFQMVNLDLEMPARLAGGPEKIKEISNPANLNENKEVGITKEVNEFFKEKTLEEKGSKFIKEANLPTFNREDLIKNAQFLNERQRKMLEIFSQSESKKLQLKNLAMIFPQLTDRTLRVDLRDLVERGYLKHEGFARGSFYTLLVS